MSCYILKVFFILFVAFLIGNVHARETLTSLGESPVFGRHSKDRVFVTNLIEQNDIFVHKLCRCERYFNCVNRDYVRLTK